MKSLAPIVLFAYNRPVHLKRTLAALQANNLAKESNLFIYSDGQKDSDLTDSVTQVREIIKTLNGFRNITPIFREKNFGLAENIIQGVTKVVNDFGKVIVLEDDLVTAPYFLQFMNDALNLYQDNTKIVEVVGYSYYQKYSKRYDIENGLLVKGADCLGWGTWKRGWEIFNPNSSDLVEQIEYRNMITEFNFDNSYDYFGMLKNQRDGKVNSWAIRWMASAFLRDMYTYYPAKSLVLHIGNDKEASNYNTQIRKDPLEVELYQGAINPTEPDFNKLDIYKMLHKKYLKSFRITFFERVQLKLLRIYSKITGRND